MSGNNVSSFRSFKLSLWLVYFSIIVSLILMAGLSAYIAPQVNNNGPVIEPGLTVMLWYIDFALLLLIIPGINFLYRKLLQQNLDKESLSKQLRGYIQSKVIIWAVIEALGIFFIVQYILSNYLNLYVVFIGVIYLLMRNMPTEREIRSIFQMSAKEIDYELENTNQ